MRPASTPPPTTGGTGTVAGSNDLQAEIDALDKKIASGVASATHKGKTVVYQGLDALRALRAELARRQSRQRRSNVTITGYDPE